MSSTLQICQLEIPVIINKFMSITWFSRYFYWNLSNRLTFMYSPLMTSINFILKDPTLTKTSVTYLIFMFRLMFIFRILFSWKSTSSQLSISFLELCTNDFHFLGVDTSNMAIGNTDIHIQIYFIDIIMKIFFIWVLCI